MRPSIDIDVENESEAERLMVYHLLLACAYFECTHEDRGLLANKEIRRVIKSENWINASSAFVDVLCSTYEEPEDGE